MKRIGKLIIDLSFLGGVALIGLGLYRAWPPLAYVYSGVFLLLVGIGAHASAGRSRG